MAGVRRKARIAALQALYELDCTRHKVGETSSRLRAGETLAQEALGFSDELVKGVLQHKSELDALIKRIAPAFPIEQMSIIDRNILRLAIFEILFGVKTPIKVVINEAIELAKTFGSESSSRLVNGVLGVVARERDERRKDGKRAEEG
ncbi:MAG: transcription antitermination factor NusB [Dehalococcoidia bacterium]|nr:transcription antitermination factor NusB [Dehalococcoidia bacterium]